MGRFTKDRAPTQGMIRWDARLQRYEFWRESRCIAHSNDLTTLRTAYPQALVGKAAHTQGAPA